MSRKVWKYTLTPEVATVVEGADPRVVHVGIDPLWLNLRVYGDPAEVREANVPTVWVELDPEGDDKLTLVFVGTGHSIPWGDCDHVGSCVTPGGLVWHVYSIDREVRSFRG